ncbi:MAG: DUF58 domain-containing protein, partial [Rubrobacter sp.]|nr:DUF58 domain-containing protein [Rubrobacter sp.]
VSGVRPTARGWQALVAAIASLAAALSLGTTQFYQLSYLLLGLLAAALALGIIGSRALRLERLMPGGEGIAAGEPVGIGIRLTNGSRLASSKVEVIDYLPNRHVSEAPPVPAGGERLIETTISFERRGVYEIGPAELAFNDPFGLLRFGREAGERAEALVYPEMHELPGRSMAGEDETGGRSRFARRGEDLSGLREYRKGDDRRMIHWKSVARTGELIVKEFEPESPRRYTVMLDLLARRAGDPRAAEREIEDAVSVAASTFAHLERSGLSPRLRLTDGATSSTGFVAGEADRSQAMRLLAAARADGAETTGEALRRELSGGLGEGVVLIQRESARSEELAEALREASVRGVSVLILLLASHTYGAHSEERRREHEAALGHGVRLLEAEGAAVRVIRAETGVRGLSGLAAPRAGEAG